MIQKRHFSILLSAVLSSLCYMPGQGLGTDRWPETGQSECYDNTTQLAACPDAGQAFHGQDASYFDLSRRYTGLDASGEEVSDNFVVVRDEVTGLMWEVKTGANKDDTFTWAQAASYADNLVLGEHSDWRLPTAQELATLVNRGRLSPAIDSDFFPNTATPPVGYWSATEFAANNDFVWNVNFRRGSVSSLSKEGSQAVRAVRNWRTPLSGGFTSSNGVAIDVATGLHWQQAIAPAASWQGALAYCEGLTLGGQNDWRVPNISELHSLVDYTNTNPAIDAAFATNPGFYWSSTTYLEFNRQAWQVSFNRGDVTVGFTDNKNLRDLNVRCVRSGMQRFLSVEEYGDADGTVASTPGGIDCGEDCIENYLFGSTVILQQTHAGGVSFLGWFGGGCSGTGNCVVTMTDSTDTVILAGFDESARNWLTVIKTGNGAVDANPAGEFNTITGCDELACVDSYANGTQVTLTAGAQGNDVFKSWSGDACAGDTSSTCVLTVTANTLVAAEFDTPFRTVLTVLKDGMGQVTSTDNPASIDCDPVCSAAFTSSDSITLHARPAAGYVFKGWSGVGVDCPGLGDCEIFTSKDRTLTAEFGEDPWELFLPAILSGSRKKE